MADKYIYNHLTNKLPNGGSGGITKEEVQTMINQALANYYKKNETYSKTGIDERLATKQTKLTLIKNEASGDTNADLSDDGKLRIWDPEFEGNKLVKSYRIIDSTVEGVTDLDTDLTTGKYQNKFFQPKTAKE